MECVLPQERAGGQVAARLGSLSPLRCPQQAPAPGCAPGSRAPMTNVCGRVCEVTEVIDGHKPLQAAGCSSVHGRAAVQEGVGGGGGTPRSGRTGPIPFLAAPKFASKLSPSHPGNNPLSSECFSPQALSPPSTLIFHGYCDVCLSVCFTPSPGVSAPQRRDSG